MLSDAIVGFIRTYVPIAVGALLALLARQFDIVIDEETTADLAVGFAGLLAAAYYTLVRLLASKWGVFGVLLGYNREPAYNDEREATSYNAVGNGA